MKILLVTRLALMLAAALAFALPARGQENPRSYVPFDIDPDYQKILRERLAMERQLGPFKDIIKQILADPAKLPLEPAKIKEAKLEDPKLKQALQDWLENDPKLRQSLIDWIVRNPPGNQSADTKQLQQEMKKLLDVPPKPKIQQEGVPVDLPRNQAEPSGVKQDPLAKLTEQAMKQTQRTKFGEWLSKSPAWQQAFADLRDTMDGKDGRHWHADGWQARLLTPDGETWKVAEDTFGRLRHLPRPNFDRFQWDLSAPDSGKIPLAGTGAANLPGASLPSFGTGATWVLLALLGGLIGWRLLRWWTPSARAVSARPDLGPWPVRLDAVSTRGELVQAFDYLALWTLGLAVKSWNHHAVAARWREKSAACAESAVTLAGLYEQARYTDGVEGLNDDQRVKARQCLAQLAEAL